MRKTEQMPLLVYVGLMGIKSRFTAMAYFGFSVMIAAIVLPEAVMLGYYYLLAFSVIPVWYWISIDWVDEHGQWER